MYEILGLEKATTFRTATTTKTTRPTIASCDSTLDCPDEMYCNDKRICKKCHDTEFKCKTSAAASFVNHACIPSYRKCDGKTDCRDGSDETIDAGCKGPCSHCYIWNTNGDPNNKGPCKVYSNDRKQCRNQAETQMCSIEPFVNFEVSKYGQCDAMSGTKN